MLVTNWNSTHLASNNSSSLNLRFAFYKDCDKFSENLIPGETKIEVCSLSETLKSPYYIEKRKRE